MPEMTFTVRWPDGSVDECYSPSLVVHDFLSIGDELRVPAFVELSGAALDQAGERVMARFGFACTSAIAERERITTRARRYDAAGSVQVLDMQPPLPESARPASGARS